MSARNYANQFRGYDNELLFLELLQRLTYLGAYDSSWGNDVCPSILIEATDTRWIKVWVDWKDEAKQESVAEVIIAIVDEEENWIEDIYEEDEADQYTAGLISLECARWIDEHGWMD